jgi:hypothetical protein
LKRVFDYVQRLIEELVQALAMRLEQLRDHEARAGRVRLPARPRARNAELPRDGRDRDAGGEYLRPVSLNAARPRTSTLRSKWTKSAG